MKCVSCGRNVAMRATKESHEVRIGDRVVKGVVPGRKCPNCGEVYVEGVDIERLELAVAGEVIRLGVVDGETFRFLRKALGFTALALAELLGTTPETISRWETGARKVDRPAWLTLAMLVADRRDGRLRLRGIVDAAAAKPGTLPKTISVA